MEYFILNTRGVSTAALTDTSHLIRAASTSQKSNIEVSLESAILNRYVVKSLDEHDRINSITSTRPLTSHEFMKQQYHNGSLLNLPTRQPWSEEEKAERARLAQIFSGGKPASEMVIEDRGPY